MANFTRRGFLSLATTVGLVLHSGCNFGSLAYFIMPEQRLDAKLRHLASSDEKKKPKIVVLTYAGLDLDPDFLHADREIAENLSRDLKNLATLYKDKLEIVPQRQIEEFKNNNPSWRSQDMTDIGKKFNADYVIYLEIHSLSMKQPKNINLLSGNANLTIHLYDIKNPDETPLQQPFNFKYPPDERGGIPIDGDTHPTKFRQDFLERVAKKLVPYFAKYPRSELTSME